MTANQMLIAVSEERRTPQPAISSLSVLLLNHSFLLHQGCAFRPSLFAYINAVHHSGHEAPRPSSDRLSGF